MKWEKATLISLDEVGRDRLNNPIYEENELNTIDARFSPWSNEEIATEDRDIIKNERKVVLKMSIKNFPNCVKIKLCETYDIMSYTGVSQRFVLLRVRCVT